MKKLVNNILINLTQEEINQRQIDEQNYFVKKQERLDKKQQEQINKQSAINKLKALGLNDAEIKSIIG